jgi:hypothetical protein
MHLCHFDSHSFEYGVSAVQVGLNDCVMNWQTQRLLRLKCTGVKCFNERTQKSKFFTQFFEFFFCGSTVQLGPGLPLFGVCRSHIIRYTAGWTPLNEWSVRRRSHYLNKTQRTQKANIHALSGIRTCDSSNRVASDLRVRPSGHRNRLVFKLWNRIFCVIRVLVNCSVQNILRGQDYRLSIVACNYVLELFTEIFILSNSASHLVWNFPLVFRLQLTIYVVKTSPSSDKGLMALLRWA